MNIESLSTLDWTPTFLLGADFSLIGFALHLLLFATSLWLIFLVLIQRGKGGGLTGALGGSGGSSAFGAKAGDAFTWITVISSAVWIFLCMLTIASINPPPPPPVDEEAAMMGALENMESGGSDSAPTATDDNAPTQQNPADETTPAANDSGQTSTEESDENSFDTDEQQTESEVVPELEAPESEGETESTDDGQ